MAKKTNKGVCTIYQGEFFTFDVQGRVLYFISAMVTLPLSKTKNRYNYNMKISIYGLEPGG